MANDDDDDDDDDADRPTLVLGSMHEMTRRVGRVGRPLGAGSVEIDADRNSQGIYAYFFQRTAAQYDGSLRRARAILARSWAELDLPSATNDPQLAEAMQRQITALATSFRTLAFREMVLYITTMCERPRGLPSLPRLSDPLSDLNAEQEEALFRELEDLGAFEVDGRREGYVGLDNNRERWRMHRERDGEVWLLQRGVWAGFAAE